MTDEKNPLNNLALVAGAFVEAVNKVKPEVSERLLRAGYELSTAMKHFVDAFSEALVDSGYNPDESNTQPAEGAADGANASLSTAVETGVSSESAEAPVPPNPTASADPDAPAPPPPPPA